MEHRHDWRVGPMTDFTGKLQTICVDCLDMGEMTPREAEGHLKWTEADAIRLSDRIEKRYGNV